MSAEEQKNEIGKQEIEQSSGESVTSTTLTPSSLQNMALQKIEQVREQSERGIKYVYYILSGIVIFITVSFIVAVCTMNFDRIKDKELYLKYDGLFQRYVDENSKLKDEITCQKIEINNLHNQMDLLKAKNPQLK